LGDIAGIDRIGSVAQILEFTGTPRMTSSTKEHATTSSREFVKQSSLYQEFLAEREEILKHKWLESERLGYDIGFERALLDWIRKHREGWRAARRQNLSAPPGASASPFSPSGGKST
jgi:hypothetical protein